MFPLSRKGSQKGEKKDQYKPFAMHYLGQNLIPFFFVIEAKAS